MTMNWNTAPVAEAVAPAPNPNWKSDPATEKQIAFLTKLVSEKDPTNITTVLAAEMLAVGHLTKGQAHATIDAVKALPIFKKMTVAYTPNVEHVTFDPPAAVVAPAPVQITHPVTVGIYDFSPQMGEPESIPSHGRWFIVYKSKVGSFRVKRLYKSWDTKSGFSWKGTNSWQFLKGIETGKYPKVPLGDIKKLGKEIGFCMYCGLMLTDPESRHRGYGPICADHYGLPYGV